MNIHADLFLTFCRIGGLTFGGGYAMLPMLQREAVEKKGWVTEAELMDYFAIGQCLPGVIAVNAALFVGHKVKGARGAVAAALGVVFPSFAVIVAIAAFISNFSHIAWVQSAFAGIRACVFVLVLNAILKLRKGSLKDLPTLAVALIVCVLSIMLNVSPIVYVAGAALFGVFARQWYQPLNAWVSKLLTGGGKADKKP